MTSGTPQFRLSLAGPPFPHHSATIMSRKLPPLPSPHLRPEISPRSGSTSEEWVPPSRQPSARAVSPGDERARFEGIDRLSDGVHAYAHDQCSTARILARSSIVPITLIPTTASNARSYYPTPAQSIITALDSRPHRNGWRGTRQLATLTRCERIWT